MASGDTIYAMAAPYGRRNTEIADYDSWAFLCDFLGASSPRERWLVYGFKPSAVQYIDWLFTMPPGYDGHGLDAHLEVFDDTNLTTVRYEMGWRKVDPSEVWSGSHTYVYQSANIDLTGSTGTRKEGTISFLPNKNQLDGIVAGDRCLARVRRNGTHADDDNANYNYLTRIHLVERFP